MPYLVVFPAAQVPGVFHHQHGTSVPSNTYSRRGLRSLGLGGGGSTISRVPEYVIDGSGDSGLGRTKNTS